MSEQEQQNIVEPLLAQVGKWAIGIIVTIAIFGFSAGAWATKQDIRTTSLEAKAKEAMDWRDAYDKRQRRIESLAVKVAEKMGIDTSRIED